MPLTATTRNWRPSLHLEEEDPNFGIEKDEVAFALALASAPLPLPGGTMKYQPVVVESGEGMPDVTLGVRDD